MSKLHIALIAFTLAIAPLSIATSPAFASQTTDLPPGEDAVVTRVIDGDTIQVTLARKRYTVRYIGVDSPESVKPNTPVQCFAKEATAFNRQLVLRQKVRLEGDVNNVDSFGRLLRYVYLQDGRMVNEELVKGGFAYASSYPPDVKHQDKFAVAQQGAVEEATGLWTACAMPVEAASAPQAPLAPTPEPVAAVVAPAPANCDSAYPTICIPVGSPDLDCPDIPHKRFEVRPPDPHRFDGDDDGIGCEK